MNCIFIAYKAVRRNFWIKLSRAFDRYFKVGNSLSDGSLSLNRVEFTTMLDSIGSTFTDESIDAFFISEDLDSDEIALSYEQIHERLEQKMHGSSENIGRRTTDLSSDLSAVNRQFSRQTTERLCQIKFCPLCTKSLDDNLDLQIISHVSVCSFEDYAKLDSMLLGGFLTETYTSPKWVTKIINRVTQKASGRISGGQIQCLDRMTGQLVEEKIPMYIRLGIRLLFQFYGSRTIIETKAIKKVLRGLTLKQGSKFNDPKSKSYIQTFINYHKINMDEGISFF